MNPNEPIVIEETFNVPVEKVWQAITRKDLMKDWYFDLAEFKPEVGFEFRFEGGDGKTTFLHICEITEVKPNQKLTHSWRYDGFPGNTFVTFELTPEGAKTHLKLTHTGLETLPASEPAFAKDNFVKGWTSIIKTSLKDYLEKKPVKNN